MASVEPWSVTIAKSTPLREVVLQIRLQKLLLVSDEEGHHQSHPGGVAGRMVGKRECITDQAVVSSVAARLSTE